MSSTFRRAAFHLRRPLAAAAGCATSAALAAYVASPTTCEPAKSNTLSAVNVIERARELWIEVEQRELADSLVNWSDPDSAYIDALKSLRSSYDMPAATMQGLKDYFLSEATKGLAGEESSLRMLPTYVDRRVTGNEKGDYYALDLGGTNFRVLRLTLLGNGKVGPVTQGKFKIPKEIKESDAEGLFGFLADSVATFLATKCGGNPTGALGFTFSFPTVQDSLNSGKLIVWNKEFTADGCVGEDVVKLLQTQFDKRGIALEVKALANDTVGTMEAAAYKYPQTAMGVILGTGTNAAYIEKTSKVGKWGGKASEEHVINTEWGNLDMASVMTVYDAGIDLASQNPTLQRFEKMISGMYLGELCRTSILSPEVLPAFSDEFKSSLQSTFGERMSMPTSLMSAIESDSSPRLAAAAEALSEAGLPRSTVRDRVLLREACVCISTRAARLSAVGIVSLLEQMGEGKEGATIAIDGTVFECYPYFKERMEFGVELLVGRENAKGIDLILAKDGSGVGSAIIAAIAASQ